MSEPQTLPLSLGGRAFDVPRLPLRTTIVVYPICQRLTNARFAERVADTPFEVTQEEMAELATLAFELAEAADPTVDPNDLLALPIEPMELIAAFFVARLQCGGWRPVSAEGGDAPGEGKGALETPPTSTSTASSQSSSDTSISPKNTG